MRLRGPSLSGHPPGTDDVRRVKSCGNMGTVPPIRNTLPSAPSRPQNPSPMIERTRAHERVADQGPTGQRFNVDGLLPRPVAVFVPAGVQPSEGA